MSSRGHKGAARHGRQRGRAAATGRRPSGFFHSCGSLAAAPWRWIRRRPQAVPPLVFAFGALVVAVIYGHGLWHNFVWQDLSLHLLSNPALNPATGSSLAAFWNSAYQQLYTPLAYSLWGLAQMLADPWSETFHSAPLYRALNLALHLANGLLLYRLLVRLSPTLTPSSGPWIGMAATLLFWLHPIQVEAVVYASQMRIVLAATLTLTSLWLYCRFRRGSRPAAALSWLVAALAPLAHPAALVAAPLILALERQLFSAQGRWLETLKYAALWFVPALAVAAVGTVIQGAQLWPDTFSWWQAPFIWLDVAALSVFKIFAPLNLAPGYGRAPTTLFAGTGVYAAAAAALIGLAAAFWFSRNRPLPRLALLLFVVGLLPAWVLVFAYEEGQHAADSLIYLAFVGVALAFALLLQRLLQTRLQRWLRPATVALLIALGSWSRVVQIPMWADGLTLWQRAAEAWPADALSHYHLSLQYDSTDPEQSQLALDSACRAAEANPRFARGLSRLAELLLEQDRQEEAEELFNEALLLAPTDPAALYGLAYLRRQEGEIEEAQRLLRLFFVRGHVALHLLLPALIMRGEISLEQEKFADALNDFTLVLGQQPFNGKVVELYAQSLASLQGAAAGIDFLTRVYQLSEGRLRGLLMLRGILWEEVGRYRRALEDYTAVYDGNPDNPRARTAVARARYRLGEQAAAEQILQSVLSRHEDVGDAWSLSAEIKADRGDFASAGEDLRRAFEFNGIVSSELASRIGRRIEGAGGEDRNPGR